MVPVLDSVEFLDAQGVAVPDDGASVPRIKEVFQNAGDIAGPLFQNRTHSPFAFRGEKPFQIFLQAFFVFTEHVVEDNSTKPSGSSIFPLCPCLPRIE